MKDKRWMFFVSGLVIVVFLVMLLISNQELKIFREELEKKNAILEDLEKQLIVDNQEQKDDGEKPVNLLTLMTEDIAKLKEDVKDLDKSKSLVPAEMIQANGQYIITTLPSHDSKGIVAKIPDIINRVKPYKSIDGKTLYLYYIGQYGLMDLVAEYKIVATGEYKDDLDYKIIISNDDNYLLTKILERKDLPDNNDNKNYKLISSIIDDNISISLSEDIYKDLAEKNKKAKEEEAKKEEDEKAKEEAKKEEDEKAKGNVDEEKNTPIKEEVKDKDLSDKNPTDKEDKTQTIDNKKDDQDQTKDEAPIDKDTIKEELDKEDISSEQKKPDKN